MTTSQDTQNIQTDVSRPRNQYGDEMMLVEMCMELHWRNYADEERRQHLRSFLSGTLVRWQTTDSKFDAALHALIVTAMNEDMWT